jgi:Succinate dehydrogenase/fumarate reductase, flavoprotein subunit
MTALRKLSFDAVVIGGGGAGMRASLQMAQSGFKNSLFD